MNLAEMAVTILIALALVFFVLRPLIKRVLALENKTLALPPSAELGHHGSGTAMVPGDFAPGAAPLVSPGLEGNYDEEDEPQRPRTPAWMNNAKALGEQQAATLKTVGQLVDENPRQAALIVRDWLAGTT